MDGFKVYMISSLGQLALDILKSYLTLSMRIVSNKCFPSLYFSCQDIPGYASTNPFHGAFKTVWFRSCSTDTRLIFVTIGWHLRRRVLSSICASVHLFFHVRSTQLWNFSLLEETTFSLHFHGFQMSAWNLTDMHVTRNRLLFRVVAHSQYLRVLWSFKNFHHRPGTVLRDDLLLYLFKNFIHAPEIWWGEAQIAIWNSQSRLNFARSKELFFKLFCVLLMSTGPGLFIWL